MERNSAADPRPGARTEPDAELQVCVWESGAGLLARRRRPQPTPIRQGSTELTHKAWWGGWGSNRSSTTVAFVSSPLPAAVDNESASAGCVRYFAPDGTDHADHHEQAGMIRRYIDWRNRHVTDPKLRKTVAGHLGGETAADLVCARGANSHVQFRAFGEAAGFGEQPAG